MKSVIERITSVENLCKTWVLFILRSSHFIFIYLHNLCFLLFNDEMSQLIIEDERISSSTASYVFQLWPLARNLSARGLISASVSAHFRRTFCVPLLRSDVSLVVCNFQSDYNVRQLIESKQNSQRQISSLGGFCHPAAFSSRWCFSDIFQLITNNEWFNICIIMKKHYNSNAVTMFIRGGNLRLRTCEDDSCFDDIDDKNYQLKRDMKSLNDYLPRRLSCRKHKTWPFKAPVEQERESELRDQRVYL